MSQIKISLDESDIPTDWYNVVADLPNSQRRPALRRGMRFASITAAVCLALAGCARPIDFGAAVSTSPGAVTGVHHILLTVSNLGRSIGFYRDVLGMKVEYRSFHFAMLTAGNFGVALSDKPWDFEKKGGPKGVGMIPHFTTPDMDAFAARLKENGIPWLRGPQKEFFGVEAFIEDPDGYQWAIVAPLTPK